MLNVKRDTRATQQKAGEGFTIVELLVVIVVIAILAAISIVAYTGIQQRARVASLSSALSQASKKVSVYQAENGTYPTSLTEAGIANESSVSYTYTTADDNFCITALYDGKMPYSLAKSGEVKEGPCEGHSGGASYCPNDSYVSINGYYCNGAEDTTAAGQSNITKLSATASGVPSGAPAAFVGRQATRDAYLSASFPVTAGEVYCVEGWVASGTSTVTHSFGLQMVGAGKSNIWHDGSTVGGWARSNPTSTWKKIRGCITVPADYTSARVWSQNNGTNGSSADGTWYHTAIKFTKQS